MITGQKRPKNWAWDEAILKEICDMLSRGFFRVVVYDFLKIGKERFDHWMRGKEFREAVLHAEACYFKQFQERWLESARTSLPEAKEVARARFAETLDPRRAADSAPVVKKVNIIVKKYTLKGAKP